MKHFQLIIIITLVYVAVAGFFGILGPNIAYELEDPCPYGYTQSFHTQGSYFILPGFKCVQPDSPWIAILRNPSYLLTSTLPAFLNAMETFVFDYLNRPGELIASFYPITAAEEKYLFWSDQSYWTLVGVPSLLLYITIGLLIHSLWRRWHHREVGTTSTY